MLERFPTTSRRRAPAPSSFWPSSATTAGACCTWKDGEASSTATSRTAFLLEALLTLYEASFEPRWFAAARRPWPTR